MQKEMRAIIIGNGHHNTLGLVRSLGEMGIIHIDLVLLDSKNSFVAGSKYIDRVHYCKSSELALCLDQLSNGKPAVLFPAGDNAALSIDQYMASHPDTAFIAPSVYQKYGSLEQLMEKESLSSIVSGTSLFIPKAFAVDIRKHDIPSFETALTDHAMAYPVIVKPSASVHGSKAEIRVLHSTDHLSAFLSARAHSEHHAFLVQEYIDMDAEYGIQGVALADGSVYIPGIVQKIRKSVVSRGSTTYAHLQSTDPFIDTSDMQRMIQNTGFSGIFDIEVMRKGNDLYLCEINFRNGAYGYAYTKAGANLSYYWLCDCLHLPCNRIVSISPQYLINEIGDWYFFRRHEVPFLTWIKQFLKADVKLFWNRQDPRPFWIRLMKKFI